MKIILYSSVALFSIALYACSQTPSSVGPPSGPAVTLSLAGYGETIDSSFYKVWSDSSWEQFYMDTTIGGTPYRVLMTSDSSTYLYGPAGYSGFGYAGYSGSYIVLFDSALASLPDSMMEGQTYATQTTFKYQGTTYSLIDQETLVDSTTITVPFGTFSNCRVLESIGAIGGQLQYANYVWLAQGPSDIARQDYYYGYTITMAYGFVNGQDWGTTFSGAPPVPPRISPGTVAAKAGTSNRSVQPFEDIRSLTPKILRGIIR